MQVEVLLGGLALCAALFPSSGGAPVDRRNEDTPPDSSKSYYQPYTREEELFIIDQLTSIRGGITISVWINIARAHKRKRDSAAKGFNYDRTPVALRTRFNRYMRKGKGIVSVPDSIKKRVTGPRFNYDSEEEKLINEKLLSHTGKSLFNEELWKQIKKEHDLRRESKAVGFVHKRTARGLSGHFQHYMRPKGRVALDVMRKFPFLLKGKRSYKRSSKSKKKPGCSKGPAKNDEGNLDIPKRNEENLDAATVNGENVDATKNDEDLDAITDDEENVKVTENDKDLDAVTDEENVNTDKSDEENWAAPLLEAMEYLSDFVENSEEDWDDDDWTDV